MCIRDRRQPQIEGEGVENHFIILKDIKKKTEVAILISDKLYFKPKTALRDEERHYAIIKWSIQRENWTIISFNASKVGAANYINRFSVKISFIYLFDTEREQKQGQQEREKQTPHWTGSLMRASSQDPENMTWPKARA